ncbi:hypothetical protein ERC79_01305 [Rhodococcus sp. ABRD24]|uniref:hypothetical protein n=1 Tax=Rhodococcus sp. ABRD24 TaxID=2507582 RepID=UPI00103AA5BB|nr:hypothetical protein [Rhodococcus sp. ABRD24]QBJ94751.1 hypothetical protein ERC79_01305 [Rhodococcus sp. ABRD24]
MIDETPFDYELPELFADELLHLDPVATCAAVELYGPSARASVAYDRTGRRVDGLPVDDSWFAPADLAGTRPEADQ